MDIYSFINSKAISDHCRKIAHQFGPLETAYLIYANETLTISQKHAAFTELIQEQPDVEIVERLWTPRFDSLHDFLRKYIELQNKYLAVFYKDEPNCVYSFEVWYTGDQEYTKDERIFPAFRPCFKAMQAVVDDLIKAYRESGTEIAPIDIRVTKQWINAEGDEHPKLLTVCIDYSNNPMEIWQDHGIISYDDNKLFYVFDGLWPEIPTPFQKGDILVARRKLKADDTPFVLDWIPYWEEDGEYTQAVARMREYGDSSDMAACIYGQDKDGIIWHDHGPSYLDLEYCERELCGAEKFLIAISNYIKCKIPLELLICSYYILKNEHDANEERFFLRRFLDERLIQAGLKEKEEHTRSKTVDVSTLEALLSNS